MSVKHLRESFNQIASPTYVCRVALLDYRRNREVESQILTFLGMKDTGEQFTISSRPVKPDEDVNDVAAETAQLLMNEESST